MTKRLNGRKIVTANEKHDRKEKVLTADFTEVSLNTEATGHNERIVIRQVLEKEIRSYSRSVERNAKNEAYSAAASDDLIRRGISHALFVLNQKCGV